MYIVSRSTLGLCASMVGRKCVIIETQENDIGHVRQNLLQILESLDIESIFPFLLTDIRTNEPDEMSEID